MKSNGYVGVVFAQVLVMMFILPFAFVPVAKFFLPFFIWIYFQIGRDKVTLKAFQNKKFKIGDLFIGKQQFSREFWFCLMKIFLIMVGTTLFILPGVFLFIEFSFSYFVMNESPNLDIKGIFILCHELVKGFRMKIAFAFLSALSIVCASVSALFLILLFCSNFFQISSMIYIVGVSFAGIFSYLVGALPYFKFSISKIFSEAKSAKI